MEPGIAQRIAVEYAHLIYHVVMSQGEQLCQRLYHGVHGEHRERGAAGREADDRPQRTYRHGHAERRHEAKGENAETLACDDRKETQQHDWHHATRVRKSKPIEYVELKAPHHQGEKKRLWKNLSRDSDMYIVASHPHPLLGTVKLQLRADGIGGEQEDENHQYAGHHRRA